VYVIYISNVNDDAVALLAQQVSLLIRVATSSDEVVIVQENPGGSVTTHGLGASQLVRLRDAGIPLTLCVDQMAASGGYMMACVADKIVAAPFAIVGSIGVLTMAVNIDRLLKDNKVDPYLLTAGKYKRTIDLIGEVTEEGIEKTKADLGVIHEAFKGHIARYRPQIDLDKVATGEYWLSVDAMSMKLGLVDELGTSDEYLEKAAVGANVVLIQKKKAKDKSPFAMLTDCLKVNGKNGVQWLLSHIQKNRVVASF